MLQIISGKFFKSDERHVHDGKAIVYSNYAWVAPIETCVGTLHPVDTVGPVSSYVLTYKNQIEKDKENRGFLLVRTGDSEIAEQFRLICTFGFRAFFDQERDAVAVNCRNAPRDASDVYLPSVFVPRVFSPQIRGAVDEIEGFVELIANVIGLKRSVYRSVIACLSNFSHALQALNYNIDLAYSLVVYSLEALSQDFHEFSPTWEDYSEDVRCVLDRLLRGIDAEVAESIRNALLRSSHIRLQKRFNEFTVKHLRDEFFTEEAPQEGSTIKKSEMTRALRNAYYTRSAFAHRLTPIREQLRVPLLARGDVFHWENEPHLTLAGLLRVAHHAITGFIRTQQVVETEEINWRAELPGILTMEMAPKYWIWRHEGFMPSGAHKKLSGFLSQLEMVFLSESPLTSLRQLLTKYEQLFQTAKPDELQSMLALYCLYNSLVKKDEKLSNYENVCEKYNDALGRCTIQMMVTRLILRMPWNWTPSECSAAFEEYISTKFRRNSLRLPALLELAVLAGVGNQYMLEQNLSEYNKWYKDALLDAAGRGAVQALIDKSSRNQESLAYDRIIEAAKGLPKPSNREQNKA